LANPLLIHRIRAIGPQQSRLSKVRNQEIICNLRGWPTKQTDTAKTLISTCMDNGLIPEYLTSQFSSLRSLLESGVPTIRNRNGGHGQGESSVPVPEYLARYALNLTATTILFLVEAHKS
jgi:hypothetical protein